MVLEHSMCKPTITFLLMALVFAWRPASAQGLIVPEKVISEPLLWIGNQAHTSCGVRMHNMVLKGNRVLDYDLQVIYMSFQDDEGAGRATTFAVARLYETNASAMDPQATAKRIRPIDLYIAIPNVPDIFKFKSVEPGKSGTPLESFSGYPVTVDGGVPDPPAPARLMEAVIAQEPLLVSFVMDSSSTGTHIVRVVQNLSGFQQEALTDCFTRMIAKMKPASAPSGAAH